MADSTIKIEGVHPSIDGEYPLDLSAFTNRDYHDIKRIAKVRAREIIDAFENGDTDLVVAFAVIALRRAGKPAVEDALWDAPVGRITLEVGDTEEVEERPPTLAPSNGTPSAHDGGYALSERKPSSGDDSSNGTDAPESDPSPTGTPASDTGATSEWATSQT